MFIIRCYIRLSIVGNCTCEPDFAGSDCSFDLLGPPSITHISDFGLCDKSKETCEEITVFGKYFIENMNTNCYMKRKTVNTYISFFTRLSFSMNSTLKIWYIKFTIQTPISSLFVVSSGRYNSINNRLRG